MGQISINQLITKIEDGEYVLPDFQRGFVWNRTKVKKLISSLFKNYPTGTLLIWSTKQNVKLRGDKVSNDGVYTKLILDGQQRLTSIYKLFTGKEPPFYEGKKLDFNLYFNLSAENDEDRFSYWQPVKMKDSFEWINVTDFFNNHSDAGDYIEKMQESENSGIAEFFKENSTKYLKVLNQLNKIREYSYYLDEDKLKPDMEVSEVVRIFNLVNKEGRKLSEADLAMAHISMVSPKIKDEFRKELELLKSKNFEFEFDFLTTCLNGILTGRGKFDSIYNKSDSEILEAWNKTKRSVEYIINFLTSRAFIDSSNQYELRTQYLLVPLVVYVSKNNFEFKDESDLKKGLYWLYNAMIWGRYTRRGASSPLEQDVVSISKTNEIDSLIDNLKREVRDFKVKPSDLDDTPVNSPFFNLSFIIAKSKNAIDWFNGVKLHSNLTGKTYELEKHHIFPKDLLKKNNLFTTREQKATANSLLNRAFLTQRANLRASNKKPETYLKQVRDKYSNALEQQFVPMKEDYWKIENFADFLQLRAEIISKAMNKFLSDLINKKEEKINVSEIIQEGEHQNLEFKSTFYYDINQEKPNKERKFDITKTIAGFLNADGGTLLVGVEDDGNVYGLEKDYNSSFKKNKDSFLMEFRNNLESSFKDVIVRRHIEYSIQNLNGNEVLLVEIEKAREPIFLKKDNQKVLFARKGNKTEPITDAEEIHEYVQDNWQEE
jgi:hypothetical protein